MILYKEKQKKSGKNIIKRKANSSDHRININGYFTHTHRRAHTNTDNTHLHQQQSVVAKT